MFIFLTENLGTILTGVVLLAIVGAVVLKIRRDRKKNKSAGACAGCPCGCADSAALSTRLSKV